jgi:hypothetical protein
MLTVRLECSWSGFLILFDPASCTKVCMGVGSKAAHFVRGWLITAYPDKNDANPAAMRVCWCVDYEAIAPKP